MTSSPLRIVACIALSMTVGSAARQAPAAEGLPAYTIDDADTSYHGPVMAETVPAPAPENTFRPLLPIPMTGGDEHLTMPNLGVAPTESSGTWLRRGLWYADIEGVVMTRTWDSGDNVLFQELDIIQNQVILTVGVTNAAFTQVIQDATAGETSPVSEGMPRLTLGRFLFRDIENRDHTFEMSVFGGGEFNEQQDLEAIYTDPFSGRGFVQQLPDGSFRSELGLQFPNDGDHPLNIDTPDGRPGFDGASAAQSDYASRFHDWQWNYRVNQRMNKDRMELLPTGEWVRRATNGFTWSYLAGVRYFDLEETLDVTAQSIGSFRANTNFGETDIDGQYHIQSSNNLFGGQLGLELTYETNRWNLTLHSRHGFYVNDARVTEDVTYQNLTSSSEQIPFTLDNHGNSLSFMSQGGVTGRYHLRPNLSLRAGWEYMYASGLALAPNDLTWEPTKEVIGLTGDIFYQGFSSGLEYFW